MDTKTCSKCGEVKPVDAFSVGRCQCKSCLAAYRRLRYYADTEKERARTKAYREANIEKVLASKKTRYRTNIEKIRASAKTWREANPEKVRARAFIRYNSNTEKESARINGWRKANIEKLRAYEKARVDSLSDCYVEKLITRDTPIKEVPQSLIDLKRVQVQITRKLKEFHK